MCQHAVDRFGQSFLNKIGRMCDDKVICELLICPSHWSKGTESRYRSRMVNAAGLAVLRDNYHITSMVLDWVFILSSYVELLFLCRVWSKQ